jgi:hypothetical protein
VKRWRKKVRRIKKISGFRPRNMYRGGTLEETIKNNRKQAKDM